MNPRPWNSCSAAAQRPIFSSCDQVTLARSRSPSLGRGVVSSQLWHSGALSTWARPGRALQAALRASLRVGRRFRSPPGGARPVRSNSPVRPPRSLCHSPSGRSERSFLRLWSEMKRRPSAKTSHGAQRPPGPGRSGLNHSRPAPRSLRAGSGGTAAAAETPQAGPARGCGISAAGQQPRAEPGADGETGRNGRRSCPTRAPLHGAVSGLWSASRFASQCEVSQASPESSFVARASNAP